MKILQRSFYNNGYGCDCCRQDWENSDWIEESYMLTFEQMVDKAFECFETPKDEDERAPLYEGGCVGMAYEKEGETIYGFRSRIYRIGGDVYVKIGNEEYMIHSDAERVPIFTKEEVLQKYKEQMKKTSKRR